MKKKTIAMLMALMMAATMLPVNAFAEELEAEGESDEIVEINMVGLGFFGEGGKDEVMEAINEISEAEIGVHVNYTIMDIQTYMTQVPLMIADTSQSLDLIMFNAMPTTSFPTLTAQRQLMDISEYVDEYAPEMMELMAEYVPATTIEGAIYGIPCYRMLNSSYYLVMRKDILDELGLTEEAENLESWSAYKDLLIKVRDAQDSLPDEMKTNAMMTNVDTQGTVLLGQYVDNASDEFAGDFGFESLGDVNRIIRVTDEGKVENFFASEDYRTCIERTIDFYNNDLIHKDAATSQDGADQQCANGITFSYNTASEFGVEQAKKNATGYDVICKRYVDVPIQTANGCNWGWAVSVNSEEPEAAVAFMNLMYTNQEIENLFVYGIEGRDYELNDAGEAVLLEGREYQNSDFFFGNQFNAYPAEGTGSDFRERALQQMQEAELSPYYGCMVPTEPIANTITALKTVLTKYENGLESGSAPIENLDKMIEELDGAGMQEYLDYYQNYLDEWLAQQ